jgi:acyl carrier protein
LSPGLRRLFGNLLEPEWSVSGMAIAMIQYVRDVLAAYPGLEDLAVVVHEQESVGQVLVAYVVSGGPGLNVAELHKYARKELPGSAVPAAIMVVDAIPRTATGMAEPQALPIPDLRGLKPYRPPENPRQEALCTIFAEVLARPRCGIDDDFFVLGGDSIDAMRIASQVSPALGQDISMDDLFDAPTVAEFDRLLDQISSMGDQRWLRLPTGCGECSNP